VIEFAIDGMHFERYANSKTVYLFTDNNCNYGFYEQRGFENVGERNISIDIMGSEVLLDCFLFAKTLSDTGLYADSDVTVAAIGEGD